MRVNHSGRENEVETLADENQVADCSHYCGDSVVGLSQGPYTMMFEAGDGHHSCMGTPHNPPLFCDRRLHPQCAEWIDLARVSTLPKQVGKVASTLLNEWKSIEAKVAAGEPA